MPASGTDEPPGNERPAAGRGAPTDVAEALARARAHAQRAASESVFAVHALLDAAALATSGLPSDASRLLAPLAQLLEKLAQGFAPDSDAMSSPLLEALAEALDAEIARWETRARDDAEARAVLRAFLGVRELLWELGLRRRDHAQGAPGAATGGPGPVGGPPTPRPVRRRPRVQRIPVQG
ncbi:MAG: hypothetical protein ACHQ3O_02830 [Candidatus Limnocylindria bacterium]